MKDMTLQQFADKIGIELNNDSRQTLLVMKQSGMKSTNSRQPINFLNLLR